MHKVVQESTDEHGWQYRSQWPQHALDASDELWTNHETSALDVRWRLWMSTVVRRDDVLEAKRRISGLLRSRLRGEIMVGKLTRLEEDESGNKVWVKRKCALHDETIEISDVNTGEFIDEKGILGYQIKVLDGFAFSLSRLDSSSCIIFDADSKESRRKWLIAISYQTAVRGPLIDFAPFPYAPPIGDIHNRILLCGNLLQMGLPYISWKTRFFKLTPNELQIYKGEVLKRIIKVTNSFGLCDQLAIPLILTSMTRCISYCVLLNVSYPPYQ